MGALFAAPPAIDVLENGVGFLKERNVPEAEISAERLLERVFGKTRAELYMEPEKKVSNSELEQFFALLKKRAARYPLQYLLKTVEFRNISLEAGEGCLIPRPETELLVEAVLKRAGDRDFASGTGGSAAPAAADRLRHSSFDFAKGEIKGLRELPSAKPIRRHNSKALHVLDVGTGSGNIAVSLAVERPGWQVTATDCSEEALKFAYANAQANRVNHRIRFVNCDLWEGIHQKFDLLVSNPPYLSSRDFLNLQKEVAFEPRTALAGGEDGLLFYRRIIRSTNQILKQNGMIFFEIGIGQAQSVSAELKANGFNSIEILKDYSGIDRVISAKLSSPKSTLFVVPEIFCRGPMDSRLKHSGMTT